MSLYKQVPAERLSGLNRFFDHELHKCEFLAFLAKATSGWFPKSRQGSPNSYNSYNSWLKILSLLNPWLIPFGSNGATSYIELTCSLESDVQFRPEFVVVFVFEVAVVDVVVLQWG